MSPLIPPPPTQKKEKTIKKIVHYIPNSPVHYVPDSVVHYIPKYSYNLMSLFRQIILKEKTQKFLKTIRYKTFAIGAYMVKDGNSRILKLSLAMRRREWFKRLWATSSYLKLPVTFSS